MSTVLGAARSTSLPQPCKYPNNPVENASRSSGLFPIFINYHNRSYTLEVNAHDTIKTLKEKVQRKLNTNLSQYFFANRSFLDEQKTLSDYDIKKETTLFLSDRLQGGGPPPVLGPDFTNKKNMPFAPNSGLKKGLNFEGKCTNPGCGKKNEVKCKDTGTFDVRKITQEDLSCSGCHEKLNNVAVIFYNCKFKIEGEIQDQEESIDTGWENTLVNHITVFDDNFLAYNYLKIITSSKPPVPIQEVNAIKASIQKYEAKHGLIKVTGTAEVAKLVGKVGSEFLKKGAKEIIVDGTKIIIENGGRLVADNIIIEGGNVILQGGNIISEGVRIIANKNIIMDGASIVSKGVEKKGIESVAKYVPGVSFLVGLGMAGYRVYNAKERADYWKAVAEVASGSAAFIPGYGTAISVALDAAVVGHDIYSNNKNAQYKINNIVDDDYLLLKFTERDLKNNPPNKEEVDRNYETLNNTLNPDRWDIIDQSKVHELNLLIGKLKTVKDKIYRLRGWQ